MKEYSIKQVSAMLGLSKDTLRYYDKLNIVVPKRGENDYRYYTENDVLDLKFICVMKYAGLKLKSIRIILNNRRSNQSGCLEKTLEILEDKKQETARRIQSLQFIEVLLVNSIEQIKHKEFKKEVENLVLEIFDRIKE